MLFSFKINSSSLARAKILTCFFRYFFSSTGPLHSFLQLQKQEERKGAGERRCHAEHYINLQRTYPDKLKFLLPLVSRQEGWVTHYFSPFTLLFLLLILYLNPIEIGNAIEKKDFSRETRWKWTLNEELGLGWAKMYNMPLALILPLQFLWCTSAPLVLQVLNPSLQVVYS